MANISQSQGRAKEAFDKVEKAAAAVEVGRLVAGWVGAFQPITLTESGESSENSRIAGFYQPLIKIINHLSVPLSFRKGLVKLWFGFPMNHVRFDWLEGVR